MSLEVTNPPSDWSVDKADLDPDFYWGSHGEGTSTCKSVGLSNPQPLMIKSRDAGLDAYMFTASGASGSGCYLWNMMTGDVFEYTKPTDLESILAEMRKPAGQGSVERKLLPIVADF